MTLSICLWIMLPSTAKAACSVSASGVSFGSYSMLTPSPRDSSGSVTVSCTVLLALFMTINTDLSVGNSGSYSLRQLANGGNNLNYNLYMDAGRSTIWGNGSSGTSRQVYSALLSIGTTNLPYVVYGRIPAGQGSPGGVYNDTIVVSVTF